jgi:hypothetical protein
MLKKLIILLLCMMMVMPAAVLAQEDEPPVLEKPANLGVRNDRDITMILRLTQPDSIMKHMENNWYIACEIDWKINDGPWQTEKNWEGVFIPDGLWSYYEETFGDLEIFHAIASMGHDDRNAVDIPMHHWSIGLQSPYDLQNNTYSFRYRYIIDYPAQDPATGEWGYMVVTSPYSNVVTMGKGQGSAIPDKLEAPANLKVELKTREDTGMPYFYFTLDIPKSVEEANKAIPVSTRVDWKIGDGKWTTESDGLPFSAAGLMLTDALEGDPVDEGEWGEIDIKKNTYYFRAYFELEKLDGTVVKSPFSNIVEIGTSAFYSGASNWAKQELQRAYDLGLIPDILKGADMTKPITREEFAELAVLLYEKVTDKKSTPVSPNPFTDTKNQQILKAYNLGITTGTSTTTFSPKVLINREQCATMLFRAIKAIHPQGDYSIAGVKDFPDQKHISSWAVEATKYMSKVGIITGDKNGNFMPKATTKAEEAAGYGMATREQAIALSLRTHDKAPQIKQSKGTGSPGTSEGGASLNSLISKAKAIDTGYFEGTWDIQGNITEEKCWKKGNMVKIVQKEMFGEKRTKVDILDMSKGIGYSYFEGQSEAVKTIYEVKDPSEYINPFNIIGPSSLGSEAESAPVTEITGNETVDGINCSVITVTADGKVFAKIWVSEDGLKRKSEMPYFGFQRTTVYKNYKIGGAISDSEFELPDGMTINEDISVTITE